MEVNERDERLPHTIGARRDDPLGHERVELPQEVIVDARHEAWHTYSDVADSASPTAFAYAS